jgi:hypothetical protein
MQIIEAEGNEAKNSKSRLSCGETWETWGFHDISGNLLDVLTAQVIATRITTD